MNALEIAKINQTIKEIRAEISKIEGDYAPKELNVTEVKKPPIFNINGLDE